MDLIGTTSRTNFTRPATFGRRHHSPPYNMYCDFPWGLHPNDIFSWDSQMGVPKLGHYCPKIPNAHIFFKWNYLEHVRALTYSPQKYFSNNVLHTPIEDHLTLILRVFVVGSQMSFGVPAWVQPQNGSALGSHWT